MDAAQETRTIDSPNPGLGWLGTLLRATMAGGIYWALGGLTLLLAMPPSHAPAVSPAVGVSLVSALHWGPRVVPGIAVGAALVAIGGILDTSTPAATARSIVVAAIVGIGVAAQAALGAHLVRKHVGYPTPLQTDRDVAAFAFWGGPVACLVGPTVGLVALVGSGAAPWTNVAFGWWRWWVSDAIGVLIFAPLALLVFPSPHAIWRQRRGIVGLPVLLGFALVTSLFLRITTWEDTRLRADFERRAAPLSRALHGKLAEYEAIVTFLSNLFHASDAVTEDEFREYTIPALRLYPGIQGLGWSPIVKHADRERYEAEARQRGIDGFAFMERDADGRYRRAGVRQTYAPAYYLEPAELGAAALGFDIASEPAIADALERARLSGTPSSTAAIRVLRGREDQAGLLLVAPVYARAGAVGDGGSPRLLGYTFAVLRSDEIVTSALRELDREGIDYELVDEEVDDGRTVLFTARQQNGASVERPLSAATIRPRTWTDTLPFGGRTWRLNVTANPPEADATRSWQAWLVKATGLLLVGLLGGVLLATTGRASTLRESVDRFRALVDASAQIVWTTSAEGEVIDDSPSWRAFTGQTYEQWRGRGWLDALHPDDRERAYAAWRTATRLKSTYDTEYRVRHVSGQWRWTCARGVPLIDEHGEVRGWVGMNTDIHDRKLAERERSELLGELRSLNTQLEARVTERTSALSKALKEREVLIQEIHHRVKNNLQVISSLIHMQVRKLEAGASREALEECRSRVQAIALIHEKLYQSRDYASVPFSEYAASLAGDVLHAAGINPDAVKLELAIEDLSLAVDRAIPCGLILNELITNALKHAFKAGDGGTLRVELRALDDERLRLAVDDDGVGLPAGFDVRKSTSLGLQLVCMLAQQLDAELEVESTLGTSFRLTFRKDR